MLLFALSVAHADVALCVPAETLYAWPETGATDVPVNAAPFALIGQCEDSGTAVTLTLTDAAGVEVATADTSVAAGSEFVLLTPGTLAISANTAYTLDITPEVASAVTAGFTTGTSTASPLAAGPTLTIQSVVAGDGSLSGSVLDVGLPDGAVAAQVLDGDGVALALRPAFLFDEPAEVPTTVEAGAEQCFTVRALGAEGTWVDGETACATAEAEPSAICGLVDPTGGLALGIGAALLARRRSRRA